MPALHALCPLIVNQLLPGGAPAAATAARLCPIPPASLCPPPTHPSTHPPTFLPCSDTPKQIKSKVNKYAFSGGGATVEEHREKGEHSGRAIACDCQ